MSYPGELIGVQHKLKVIIIGESFNQNALKKMNKLILKGLL